MSVETSDPLKEAPSDAELVAAAKSGDRSALDALVRRHQAFVYNLALRMVWNPEDARDVTQEVLTKVVTRLATFRGESAFRTWVYRITTNHVLNMKKRGSERSELSFDEYAARIRSCPDGEPPRGGEFAADSLALVEESKLACMTGMLLCLSREQRLVFVLGLLGVDHAMGAEVLGTSRANYRQKLSRARRDLLSFMNQQCGLVDPSNPCRCAKKTRAFIAAGVVDPEKLRFHRSHVARVKDVVEDRAEELGERLALFAEHPYPQDEDWASVVADVKP